MHTKKRQHTNNTNINNNMNVNHHTPLIPLSDQIKRGMVRNILEPENAMTIDSRAGGQGRRRRPRGIYPRMEEFQRLLFRQQLVASFDSIKGRSLGRQLQAFLPFVTGYVAYWIT